MITPIECPHCFSTVGVLPDGICPSCKKNVREMTDASANLCKGWIRDGQRLPSFCVDCNEPTERRVSVKRFSKGTAASRDDTGTVLYILSLPLGIINALLPWGKRKDEVKIVCVIPQCRSCGARKQIEPHQIDFERASMSFVMCKRFYSRIKDS